MFQKPGWIIDIHEYVATLGNAMMSYMDSKMKKVPFAGTGVDEFGTEAEELTFEAYIQT